MLEHANEVCLEAALRAQVSSYLRLADVLDALTPTLSRGTHNFYFHVPAILTLHPGSGFTLDRRRTMGMTIGAVAEAAGVNVATVRYYERRGIIAEPRRTASGYRQYDESAVARIRFIRRAQELGFSLDEIRELLALRVDDPTACGAVESATRAKLEYVESRIQELERLRGILKDLIGSCRARQATSECPVLELLEDG
jgi:MerR family transcriptional regulator, copper efflux regulator